jgi:hypothetical protein
MALDDSFELKKLLFLAGHVSEIHVQVTGKQQANGGALPAPRRAALRRLDYQGHDGFTQRLARKLRLLCM